MRLTIYIDPVTGEQVGTDEARDDYYEGPGAYHRPFGWVPALEIHFDSVFNDWDFEIHGAIWDWWQEAPERAWGAIYRDWGQYGWPVPRKPVTTAMVDAMLKKGYITPIKAAYEVEMIGLIDCLRKDHNRLMYGEPAPRAEQRRWGWWAL